jgi:hypothetical protein
MQLFLSMKQSNKFLFLIVDIYSMSITNGPVCSTDQSLGDSVSTLLNWYITTKGDTIRICTTRNVLSNATGYPGEICVGTTGGVTYLYYCIANAEWGRVAFTTGY